MNKKITFLLLICSLMLQLCGCWNYRGVNELAIMSGVAIDKDEGSDNYHLTFETVDLTASAKDKSIEPKVIECDGKTIFEATRNAKKRIPTKLYFGDAQLIIISEKIAKEDGINSVIDLFLRDAEPRETLSIVISQEKTAKEFFINSGDKSSMIAYDVKKIIDEDEKTTSSTADIPIYKVYNILKGQGKSLVLPALHNTTNKNKQVAELNGDAVFKEDKLLGYLTPEETKYYLFSINDVDGGVFTCSYNQGEPDDISLEISKSDTKRSYTYDNNKIKFVIKTKTTVFLGETKNKIDVLNEQEIKKIEKNAGELLSQRMTNVIKKVQKEYGSDIFGFGNTIYKTNPKLWTKIGKNWDTQFKTMEFEVKSEVEIVNTAFMK